MSESQLQRTEVDEIRAVPAANGASSATADTERSPWTRPLPAFRAGLALLLTLLWSWPLDLWMRVGVLYRLRNDEPRRLRAVNGMIRLWGASVFGLSRRILGLRVRVEGTVPTSGRYFLMCNHQSSLDVPALISVFRGLDLKFVAMNELKYGKPAVSIALRNGGFAFVAKKDLGVDLAHLRDFARGLERFGGSPAIFPEGRRTDDGSILPFHLAGTEVIRRNAKLPVIPVTIDGLWPARTILQLPDIAGSTVTIRVSDPIPFEHIARAPREVGRWIEEHIRRNLDEIRGIRSPEDDVSDVPDERQVPSAS